MMISPLREHHILAQLQKEGDQLKHCQRHYLVLVFEEIIMLVYQTFAKWVIIELLIVVAKFLLEVDEKPALQNVDKNAKYLGVKDPDFHNTEQIDCFKVKQVYLRHLLNDLFHICHSLISFVLDEEIGSHVNADTDHC